MQRSAAEGRRCCHQQTRLLPTAGGAAASDGLVCYKWRLPCALQRTADLATNGRRPCYQWPATLLQGRIALLPRSGGLAAKGRRPCYQGQASLLQSVTVVASLLQAAASMATIAQRRPEPSTLLQRHIKAATKVHHCCYHGLSAALLQALTKLLLHRLVLRRRSLPAKEQRPRSRMRRKSGEEDAQQEEGICFCDAMAGVLRRHPDEVLRRGSDGFFG